MTASASAAKSQNLMGVNMPYYIARDQFGTYYDRLGNHPRKELLKRLDRKHADKIYSENKKTGIARHCGYLIRGLWLEVFEVRPINA